MSSHVGEAANVDVVVQAAGAAVALVAAAVAAVAAIKAHGRAKSMGDLQRRDLMVHHLSMTEAHLREIRAWAETCIVALSEAVALCYRDRTRPHAGPDFFNSREEVLVKLSTMIDVGRFFFPNEHAKTVGQHKEGAFRGLRLPAMDRLVEAFNIVKKLKCAEQGPERDVADVLVKKKRAFVTEVQDRLEVREMQARINQLEEALGRQFAASLANADD